jgi:cyclopropane fatty-acyl-phospholipid synthase-like methyltransferase
MSITRWILFTLAYFKKPRWDTGISPPELLDFITHHTPGKALDIGCGSGTNAITLAQHGWQVVGVDFIPSIISKARSKAHKAGVNAKFLIADASRLTNIGEPFDMILDIGCFHSLGADEQLRYIRNLDHLLGAGGFFLHYTFIKEAGDTRPGITEQDVQNLSSSLAQVWRQDGEDNNGRKSAWVCWEKR